MDTILELGVWIAAEMVGIVVEGLLIATARFWFALVTTLTSVGLLWWWMSLPS